MRSVGLGDAPRTKGMRRRKIPVPAWFAAEGKTLQLGWEGGWQTVPGPCASLFRPLPAAPVPPAPSSSPAGTGMRFSHHGVRRWGRLYKETQTYGGLQGLYQPMAIRKEGRGCKDQSLAGFSRAPPWSGRVSGPLCLSPAGGITYLMADKAPKVT